LAVFVTLAMLAIIAVGCVIAHAARAEVVALVSRGSDPREDLLVSGFMGPELAPKDVTTPACTSSGIGLSVERKPGWHDPASIIIGAGEPERAQGTR
jgi:hypothetical protein